MSKNAYPKVFGIGLSRTGTTSLTSALRILGYKSIHYPLSIVKYNKDGSLSLNPKGIQKYDALTDIPVACFYKDIDRAFPGSQFILTVRSAESWIMSMRRLSRAYVFIRWFPKVEQLFFQTYGVHAFEDESALQARYKLYNQEVLQYFSGREADLLVLNVQEEDPWELLCRFLNHMVPSGIPFPWNNRRYMTIISNLSDFLRSAFIRP